MIRVIPPPSKDFTMSDVKYPANSKGGLIAPGMAVSVTIKFFPDSLGNFKDFIKYETETGSAEVVTYCNQ